MSVKIEINTTQDLLKLPISKLVHANLTDFSGKYFDKIYQEVTRLESSLSSQNSKDYENNYQYQYFPQLIEENSKLSSKPKSSEEIIKSPEDFPTSNKNSRNVLSKSISYRVFSDIKNVDISKFSMIFPLKKINFVINFRTAFGDEIGILGDCEQLGKWNKGKISYLKWHQDNFWKGEIEINSELKDFQFKFVIVNRRKFIKSWGGGENNKVDIEKLIRNIQVNSFGKYDKYCDYIYNKNNGEVILQYQWK